MEDSEKGKIIEGFGIFGLHDSFIKYDNTEKTKYIENIDIYEEQVECDKMEYKNIKAFRIKNTNYFLRIEYADEYISPITDIKVVSLSEASPFFMVYKI